MYNIYMYICNIYIYIYIYIHHMIEVRMPTTFRFVFGPISYSNDFILLFIFYNPGFRFFYHMYANFLRCRLSLYMTVSF